MTKDTKGKVLQSVQHLADPTGRKTVRLGSYTYIPAPIHRGATNGSLMTANSSVTLNVTEGILREFMDIMSSLESDLARRWLLLQTGSRRSRVE
ncbi:hypothetical protein [Streptomyces sp. NPDC003032]